MSFIKYFLPAKNIKITGIDKITEQAVKSPHIIISLKLPLNCDIATGNVVMDSEFVTINGHIKLFHVVMNVKSANVTTAGVESGNAILKKISKKLHPSILAASSISEDMFLNHWRIRNTPKPPKIPGKINAWYVSIQCNSLIRKNNGIIFTWGGIIIVTKNIKNKKSLYLKLLLAKAYPAIDEKRTWNIVVKIATKRLFRKKRVIGSFVKTLL